MMLNVKRVLYPLYLLAVLTISACVPPQTNILSLTIEGVDSSDASFNVTDFSLDYTDSARKAQAANASATFKAYLAEVQVLMNGVDITRAMNFAENIASVATSATIHAALKEGRNTLQVKQKANSQKGIVARDLASKDFSYSAAAPQALISRVSENANLMTVAGYIISPAGVVSVKLNGEPAAIVDNKFSVQVPKAVNYALYIEDAAGMKNTKNFVANAYIQNALRLRLEDAFLNQKALHDQIKAALGSQITVPNVANPLIKLNLAVAQVEASLKNPIRIGDIDLKAIQFLPSANSAKIKISLALLDSEMRLTSSIRALLVNLALDVIAKPKSIQVDLTADVKSDAQHKLVMTVQNINVNMSGLSVQIPGLPNVFSAIISPFAEALLPAFNNIINTVMLKTMNVALKELLSQIELAIAFKTDHSHIDTQVTQLSSDAKSVYADLILGIKAVRVAKDSIGALTTKKAVDFKVPNKAQAFSAFHSAIAATTAKPVDTAESNFGIGIAADVISQFLLSLYEGGSFTMQGYLIGGRFVMQKAQPANVADFDMRIKMDLGAPPEMMFNGNGNGAQLNSNIVVPSVSMTVDLRQGGNWLSMGTIDLVAYIKAAVKVSNKEIKLIVDKQKFDLKILNIKGGYWAPEFAPLVDGALEQMKPSIADMVEQSAVVKLNIPGSRGVENVNAHLNGSNHIGVGMNVNFSKVF